MNLEFFIFGGYGQFVWTAFIFAFVSCIYLYLKTKQKLHKYEKIYIREFKEKQTVTIKTVKQKKTARESLVTN